MVFSPDLAKSAGLDDSRFPENQDEANAAENALTKELEKLSLDEHEKVLLEVHGFAAPPPEDPKQIEMHIQDMALELNKLAAGTIYEQARSLHREYVESPSFWLLFLRCFDYQARPAAELLIQHFQVKHALFGGDMEVVSRRVCYTDLSESETKLLDLGFIQALETRDVSGRTVVCSRPFLGEEATPQQVDEMNRAVWYYIMAIVQDDDDTQRSGAVFVEYNYTSWTAEMEFIQQTFAVRGVLPLRMAGAHYCYNDAALKPFVAGVHLFLVSTARIRARTHFGTATEISFVLQTFGIPTDQSPMQNDGSWSTESLQEWLRQQREAEKQHQNAGIVIPRRFDVLFGMSKSCREHTGNLRLLHLCEMHFDEYEARDRIQKTVMAERLLETIHQSNGRFLKRHATGWVEVEDDAARSKIAHYFRHMRSKKAKRPTQPEPSKSAQKRSIEDTTATPEATLG